MSNLRLYPTPPRVRADGRTFHVNLRLSVRVREQLGDNEVHALSLP